jgi:hypothetical protein
VDQNFIRVLPINNNVSDDESDTTSLDDRVELVHEKKGIVEKLANEIKELNAVNDLSATIVSGGETWQIRKGVTQAIVG